MPLVWPPGPKPGPLELFGESGNGLRPWLAGHDTGWRLVSVIRKSFSVQPAMLVPPTGQRAVVGLDSVTAVQAVVGELLQCEVASTRKQRAAITEFEVLVIWISVSVGGPRRPRVSTTIFG